MRKQLLVELEAIAEVEFRKLITEGRLRVEPPSRDQVVRTMFVEGDLVSFQLLIPGERPQDARVLATVVIDKASRQAQVECE